MFNKKKIDVAMMGGGNNSLNVSIRFSHGRKLFLKFVYPLNLELRINLYMFINTKEAHESVAKITLENKKRING